MAETVMRYRCSACNHVSWFAALKMPKMPKCTSCACNMCLQCAPPEWSSEKALCKSCDRDTEFMTDAQARRVDAQRESLQNSKGSSTSLLAKARIFVKKSATRNAAKV